MSSFDKSKNCHEYCQYAKICRYEKGEIGLDPYDCGNYYHLDDISNDAKDIEMEQRRSMAELMGVDESEVDEWW